MRATNTHNAHCGQHSMHAAHFQQSLTSLVTGLPKDTRPVIISGPSGVGKGTLFKMLQAAHPDVFELSVSHTTRGPRPGEAHEVDYYFVPMQEFEDLIAQDGFVEHAKFGGNRYGTSKKVIERLQKKGKVVILDIEMEVRSPTPSFLHKFTRKQAVVEGAG